MKRDQKFGSKGQHQHKTTPKLEYLPLTENSLVPNLHRAHYQIAILRCCGSPDSPSASPEDYGWYQDRAGRMPPKMFDTEPNVSSYTAP